MKIEDSIKRVEEILSCYDEYKKDYEEGHQSSFELDLEDFEVLKTLLQYINELKETKGMKEAIELAGMDIKSLLNYKYENERLKDKINQLEQEKSRIKK